VTAGGGRPRAGELASRARLAGGSPVAKPGGAVGDAALGGADPVVELCAFRVGGEEYVIDLRRIREILHLPPITPVPHAPGPFEGVVSLRGEIVPVIDLRRRLRGAGAPERSPEEGGRPPAAPRPGARPKVMVVNVGGRVFGLLVDAVREVVRIRRSQIGPPPLLEATGPHLFLGVCGGREARPGSSPRQAPPPPGRGQLRLLLNVKALFAPTAPPGPPDTHEEP